MERKDALKLQYKFDKCYICGKLLKESEKSFHQCSHCQHISLKKRELFLSRSDVLAGYIVLVTGGRIKIGYETSLSLLRKGATVVITTRFPVDAAGRYGQEPDFQEWSDRLMIYGMDFRNIPKVEEFIHILQEKLPYLDIIINNAAQTIARPEEYYEHLRSLEKKDLKYLSVKEQCVLQNVIAYTKDKSCVSYPVNIDDDGFLMDFRPRNSWTSKAWDVSTKEMLEVQLVNVTAPFLFVSRLVDLMRKSPHKQKFVVNVSSMEGQFSKRNKNPFHPHTNMAKAALNMLTRTIADDYHKLGIYVNSVDTGWVTDENPYPIKKKNLSRGFTPPLDAVEGASRVCDPFLDCLRENRMPDYGKFFKNYKYVKW